MVKYLLCPSCNNRLYIISFYIMSKKFVAFADGSAGLKSIETIPPSSIEESHYFCEQCNVTFDYIGLGQVRLRD